MSKYTIPSIFTAIDKFSGPVSKMGRNANTTFAKLDRKVRKIGDSAIQMGKSSAFIGGAIAAPLIIAGKSAVDFEEKMSNVSTLIDTSKESMKDMGNEVLNMATKLPVPVEELTTSLYDIRSAGIAADKSMNTLEVSAKLSAAGLATTSEATDIMTSSLNAFAAQGLSAEETANILFKTVKFGKTDISQLSVGFGNLAPSATAAKVSLEQVSAATAALTAITGDKTAPVQTKLKALFSEMTRESGKLADSYKELVGGNIALDTQTQGFDAVLMKLKKSVDGNEVAFKNMFSSIEASSAAISLTGEANAAYMSTLKDMESGTDAMSEAFKKQSETGKANMQVLKNNLEVVSIKLGTALLPVVTKLAESLLPVVENVVAWIDKNPKLVNQIAGLAVKGVALFGAISAVSFAIGGLTKLMKVARGVQAAYNIVLGVSGVFMKAAPIAIGKSSIALKSYSIATKIAAAAQAVFNAVSNLNPVFLIITGVVALTAGVYALSKAFSSASASEKINNEIKDRALENSRDQRVEAAILFEKLRNLKAGTDAYNETLAKVEEMQPGITKNFDLQTGSIKALNLAEKELTKSLIKRAEAQAAADLAQEKMKEALRKREEGPSWWTSMIGMTTPGYDAEKLNKMEAAALDLQARNLINKSAKMQAEIDLEDAARTDTGGGLLNTSGSLKGGTTKTETTTTEKQELNININGLPQGATANMSGSGIMPNLSTTN